MNWPSLLTSAIVYAAAAVASGDPLNGTALPAETRWVIHTDIDAARQATPLWELIRTRIVEGDFSSQRNAVSAAESATLEESAAPAQLVYPISDAEVARAKIVHAAHADEL